MEASAEATGEEEDAKPKSLFPLFPVSSKPSSSEAAQWLSNPSFTLDPSSIPTGAAHILPDSDDDEPAANAPPAAAPTSYDLVDTSPSPSSEDEEKRLKREEKKRRRKKRRREKEDGGTSRKSRVRAWAGSETMLAKDYHFDSHGDRDNLVYGSLYKMDIPRYNLYYYSGSSRAKLGLLYRWKASYSSMDLDGDFDVLDSKFRAGGRYCSVKYAAIERHKSFKRVRIVRKKEPLVSPGEFIPLSEPQTSPENASHSSVAKGEVEESWDDEVLRRTREFNKMSREFPHDEKIWLDFAEFQDKIASTQPQKAARLQMLEKKISILEKAVELNPENEELLLCLLKSYQARDSTDVLMDRWEKALMQHYDSCRLWKEFLLLRQGEFSRFKVSDMRRTYANAIQALSSACNKLCRQGNLNPSLQLSDPSLAQVELGLVDIFISLCRFEWQTGHHELATGLFQAEIEFSLFCPSLFLSSQSKLRLFEHFWSSNGARIGEHGAVGWSTWLEKEEKNRQTIVMEESTEEADSGGWTGWHDPSAKIETSKEPEKSIDQSVGEKEAEENHETDNIPLKDDIDTLLKNLGINVNTEPRSDVRDAETWNKWSTEELSRDCEQWMPVREHSGDDGKSRSPHSGDNLDQEENEQLSRVILFEDVNEYLFSLSSKEARFSLVSQFINFYGGKISRWTCTNSPSWIEKLLSLETLPDSAFEGTQLSEMLNGNGCSSHINLGVLLDGKNDWSRKSNMMAFLRNAILLCLNVFPRNYILEESALAAEEIFMKKLDSSTSSMNTSRGLAKSLLKNDRQDLLLCGIYARSEAAFGNMDLARKIFDMALAASVGLPLDSQENIPILYFWYAEMELAKSISWSSSDPCAQRAIHILSCLGGNMRYDPFKSQTSGLQLLRARQGFKEQIKCLRSTWARGDVKEHSIALICSACLFEILTAGCSAGLQVIEEAFSSSLPERRSRSLQLEFLWVYYIGILQKYHKQLKFSRLWENIQHGLQLYPYNPEMLNTMVEISSLLTVPNKVRLVFDEYSQRKPSVILYLFALSYELSKAGSQHRIHVILERALANDKLQKSVLLWRCYLAYEADIAHDPDAARRIFFRAIHSCPWSKRLWLDGFQKLSSILTAKELSDLHEVMQDKELNLRTDIYEILLQDEIEMRNWVSPQRRLKHIYIIHSCTMGHFLFLGLWWLKFDNTGIQTLMVQARSLWNKIVIPSSAKAANHSEQLEDGTETRFFKTPPVHP
ncbi:hypothetical protein J5N97_005660 [Dioscorea zingiberensis]|uniref:Protein NRDE2 homolog n=1 Tax=Dioscorea zingiberensis TaxID=325984 RepID=A0A9D5HSH8_9LILI|nr:hypothetical protein J5N97_005660 [Dioscorea zingiberensis]